MRVSRRGRVSYAPPVTALVQLAPLLIPVLCGLVAGWVRLFSDPSGALTALNRVALYFAFPALVVVSLLRSPPGLGVGVAFIAVNAALLLLGALGVGVAAHLVGRRPRGAYQLVIVFGNVAYLGLPFAERVLPPAGFAIAVIGVAVHVTVSLVLGPVLLLRARGSAIPWREVGARVARQPLVWAPLVGLLLQRTPAGARQEVERLLAPLAAAAAPVALFVLGLYIFQNRRVLRLGGLADVLAWVPKLVVLPLLAWGLATLVGLTPEEAGATILLAAMPTAITTFAFALDFGVGQDVTVRAIVWSSSLCLITVPLVVAWL